MVKSKLLDQASNLCEHIKLATIMEQGRKRYEEELDNWHCSEGHEAKGASEAGEKCSSLPSVWGNIRSKGPCVFGPQTSHFEAVW